MRWPDCFCLRLSGSSFGVLPAGGPSQQGILQNLKLFAASFSSYSQGASYTCVARIPWHRTIMADHTLPYEFSVMEQS